MHVCVRTCVYMCVPSRAATAETPALQPLGALPVCMGAWAHGCVGAWVRGHMGAWVHGCVDAWVGLWVREVRACLRGPALRTLRHKIGCSAAAPLLFTTCHACACAYTCASTCVSAYMWNFSVHNLLCACPYVHACQYVFVRARAHIHGRFEVQLDGVAPTRPHAPKHACKHTWIEGELDGVVAAVTANRRRASLVTSSCVPVCAHVRVCAHAQAQRVCLHTYARVRHNYLRGRSCLRCHSSRRPMRRRAHTRMCGYIHARTGQTCAARAHR